MINWKLKRKKYSDKQTVGVMDVYENDVFVFALAILEQEWNNNVKGNSCIPEGEYKIKSWNSEKHPDSFIVTGTEPRTFILFHKGNYNWHSQGCLLPGLYHKDINKDGYIDVAQSGAAMKKLNELCRGKTILLTIE